MKKYLVIFILFYSCSETSVDPDYSRVGLDYFPLQVGNYAIYEINLTEWDILDETETSMFELRTEVVDSFQNQSGEITYILHRSTRAGENEPWELETVWSTYLTSNQAVVIEENIPYLKLAFPVEEDLMWDGNRLNTLEQDDYRIDSIGGEFINEFDTIGNTLTVVQNNNEDFIIQQDRRVEIYALNIGLIYKETVLLNYCAEPDCINQQIVDSGIHYTQTIKEYGKN